MAPDAADSQIVDVSQPFIVNGERLMFPRDPNGSPGETINCGCVSLPFMDHREVRHPGDLPFSGRDLLNRKRRKVVGATGGPSPPLAPARPGSPPWKNGRPKMPARS